MHALQTRTRSPGGLSDGFINGRITWPAQGKTLGEFLPFAADDARQHAVAPIRARRVSDGSTGNSTLKVESLAKPQKEFPIVLPFVQRL
ncbi:predicted protein [Uncinocarpus reesii 1704]|uniref:Uncharacterized protein n=1 Tax=Uncinocarpus reesii (strain UAMH 1704) TaxID=336963 RepID=C4JUA2_UNCRE|nr:uncharacterized protein UREG_06041 [Uncinocarpus reesii 1704]EEP81199.1 predicted protein [Uncinocarpus reesii 1704]